LLKTFIGLVLEKINCPRSSHGKVVNDGEEASSGEREEGRGPTKMGKKIRKSEMRAKK
jgi:hypothetical protein